MSARNKRLLHRKMIIIAVIAILVLLTGIRCYHYFQSFRYMMPLEKITNFGQHKESFVQLAEYLYNRYEIVKANNDELVCIHFDFIPSANVLRIQYCYSDPKSDYTESETIPHDMLEPYKNVSKAFLENSNYGYLSGISVHDNTVAFCRVAYAIVYTHNGLPPDTIASPQSTNNINSERIGLHWFHSISDFYL